MLAQFGPRKARPASAAKPGKLMAYRAVLFDLDGTLIDSERHNLVAWRAACAHHGFALSDAFYHSLIGLSKVKADERLQEEFGPGCDVVALRETRREIFYHAWDNGSPVPWKPGLDSLLPWLEQRGVGRAVATSSSQPEAFAKLTRARLVEHFSVVVCGDEVPAGKPAPDIFLEAARRLDVDPSRCLVVEDSPWGVLAARRAGMEVVYIPDLLGPEGVEARVLASLAELPVLFGGQPDQRRSP